ncbi:MAG: type III pantothenate kinase [Pseudomonadota bacterium]
MILCLDVGNSQLFCGVFNGEELQTQFRRSSQGGASADEFGIFLCSALELNRIGRDSITNIVACSVVPDVIYSLRHCCQKYFNIDPLFMRPGIKTGLKIRYKDPREVGADRIADALGATKLYPNRNLVVVDFGTATTVCAVTRDSEFLGGNIIPGVRLAMEALEARTAQLPSVEIKPMTTAVGRTTVESIQSGLYWSSFGAVRELVQRITAEVFPDEPTLVVGTGGFASLFSDTDLFDAIVPDLILVGLLEALRLNR